MSKSTVGTVETDTGFATLYTDGSMYLNNSDYIQQLEPAQVKAAWKGGPIPFDAEMYQEVLEDCDGDEGMVGFLASWNGDWFDFGEELHTIPSKSDF